MTGADGTLPDRFTRLRRKPDAFAVEVHGEGGVGEVC